VFSAYIKIAPFLHFGCAFLNFAVHHVVLTYLSLLLAKQLLPFISLESTLEMDKTMVTAVEIPESSSNDYASKKGNDHDTLVLPSSCSSPVPSNASSDQDDDDDDESVVVLQEEEEKENGKHLVASVNDASLSSPTKKRRVHSHHHHHHHHHHQQQQWNAFVRQGTSLKGLLGNVLQLATTSTSTSAAAAAAAASSSDEDIPTTRDGETALLEMRPLHQHAADLAREKTRECMILEKVRISLFAFEILLLFYCSHSFKKIKI
jgi:hypothetical protein